MNKLLKIFILFIVALLYMVFYGMGLHIMYIFGLKEALLPIIELPNLPTYTFVALMGIYMYIKTLFPNKNQISYEVDDPKPYGIMLSKQLNLYMYNLGILTFYFIKQLV